MEPNPDLRYPGTYPGTRVLRHKPRRRLFGLRVCQALHHSPDPGCGGDRDSPLFMVKYPGFFFYKWPNCEAKTDPISSATTQILLRFGQSYTPPPELYGLRRLRGLFRPEIRGVLRDCVPVDVGCVSSGSSSIRFLAIANTTSSTS
eukprot:2096012-Rhodomonas_salina.2